MILIITASTNPGRVYPSPVNTRQRIQVPVAAIAAGDAGKLVLIRP